MVLAISSGGRSQSVDLNRWYNIVIVRDKLQEEIYLYSDSNLIITADTAAVVIGNYDESIRAGGGYSIGCGPSTDFNGELDNIMIFNRALSEEEVVAIYEAQRKD